MIIKYHPEKVYDPKAFNNAVRRATKKEVTNRYIPVRLESMATKLILGFPIIRMLLETTIKKGMKLLEKIESKQLKEENEKCQQHCLIQ